MIEEDSQKNIRKFIFHLFSSILPDFPHIILGYYPNLAQTLENVYDLAPTLGLLSKFSTAADSFEIQLSARRDPCGSHVIER